MIDTTLFFSAVGDVCEMKNVTQEGARGWVRGKAKGQDQRGGGSRKATASGVLGLGLSPVWCVCVASVVCVSGRRGERWQAPLWQCG
jgi:hypothetical protein